MKAIIGIGVALLSFGAAAQQAGGLVWTGDFETGAASLSGHCGAGDDQWCQDEIVRPQQIQVVPDPVAQGKYAIRVEVKYGDVYNGYSDSRSLMSGPSTLWEDEGSERWYRWQVLWPKDYVGQYPKWDQLSTPSAYSLGGWVVEWHHDANGGVETGSAPVYIGATNTDIILCLVDQATSECRETIPLAKLQRDHWHDFVVHALWSSDPSVGYLEIWVDGVNVLPRHYAANKYPGMRNYLIAGLYRNGEIGDPNLLWPDGTPVYGSDGAPGVVYLDGFVAGTTQASVLAERPWGVAPPAADGGAPPADAGTPGGGGADAGAPADAGVPVPPGMPPPSGPPAATTPPPAGQPPRTGFAAMGYTGCASRRPHLSWLLLLLVALAVARRRRPKRPA